MLKRKLFAQSVKVKKAIAFGANLTSEGYYLDFNIK